MINTDLLKEYFQNINIKNDYILVNQDNIFEVINFLKTRNIITFNMLLDIMAIDYIDYIQLSYRLYSSDHNEFLMINTNVLNSAKSIVSLYNSAYFNECEIFDMYGIDFINNDNLKRLYMPNSWLGYPMLKSYILEDERLAWND